MHADVDALVSLVIAYCCAGSIFRAVIASSTIFQTADSIAAEALLAVLVCIAGSFLAIASDACFRKIASLAGITGLGSVHLPGEEDYGGYH